LFFKKKYFYENFLKSPQSGPIPVQLHVFLESAWSRVFISCLFFDSLYSTPNIQSILPQSLSISLSLSPSSISFPPSTAVFNQPLALSYPVIPPLTPPSVSSFCMFSSLLNNVCVLPLKFHPKLLDNITSPNNKYVFHYIQCAFI